MEPAARNQASKEAYELRRVLRVSNMLVLREREAKLKRRARPELDGSTDAPAFALPPPLTSTPTQAEDDADADDWTAIDAEDIAEAQASTTNKTMTNKQDKATTTTMADSEARDVQLVRLYIKEINGGMRPDAVARKYHINVLNMVEAIAKFAAQKDAEVIGEAMKAGAWEKMANLNLNRK
ncbi:hypothetical protein LTR99_010032 [Exophiala xenobiotica]|uniref:Uncharacterized protein n=1 Tax=Vermiconidia calcicola TaxID=1690605 RepID=A0AAV9PX53_9PEZI|nr:hypothetical protein LTR96_005979 [Exophiala xenobiotica]KAK5529557.1 hypothetical protein LTR25_009806 [Vermiconidia calcicola]KAK5529614.1 hypothetical protein LTR23_010632 [Chaetothyriales sp. CCFEE 6169]KAK5293108.1 hypothetical protein LTR99_010032 [Exophiala xenobiotica]KAK5337536.1 hypothetical protein LTR98_006651 [Exophiala xenobiotica]